MSAMQEAVEDGVGQGGLADVLMPVIDRQLTGDQRGSPVMPVLDDLHQVVTLLAGQRLDAPVID